MVQGRYEMIRVGFILRFNESWIGGLGYFRNVLSAVHELHPRAIEPVLFTGRRTPPAQIEDFPPIEVIRTSFLDRGSVAWLLRKAVERACGRDLLLERLLLRRRVAVLSHSSPLGRGARLPTIGWIADFQHQHLPEFFSKKEISRRNAAHCRMCRDCRRVIVSSFDAQKDLAHALPGCVDKSFVLQFVADVHPPELLPNLRELQQKFGFTGRYFHVPNQFWAHKNHRVILEALEILNRDGLDVLVLATGKTEDGRRPGYYSSLMAEASKSAVKTFQVLGLVSRRELSALMYHAVALVNPSLFEGWSTSVEEAKSLKKPIILSEIPVHREQAPGNGLFFPPSDANALAAAMRKLWLSNDRDLIQDVAEQARRDLADRRKQFASRYQALVLSMIEVH
jgi:glycosyltransferase involved in cell wall biosynthesis